MKRPFMRSRKINNIWFNSTKKKIFRVGERGALLFLMNSVQYKHIYKLFMSFSFRKLCVFIYLYPLTNYITCMKFHSVTTKIARSQLVC